ncbi:PIN domain-containing protein [soil metagenome]
MVANVFLDTNIFLYSVDEAPDAASKRAVSQQLLLTEHWAWSVQVAAEFFVNATSAKRTFRLNATDALALVDVWFAFPTIQLTPALFREGVLVSQRFQLSYWDAAILAAAKQQGCHTVFSEDLNHGQNYDGVTVVNPFLPHLTK